MTTYKYELFGIDFRDLDIQFTVVLVSTGQKIKLEYYGVVPNGKLTNVTDYLSGGKNHLGKTWAAVEKELHNRAISEFIKKSYHCRLTDLGLEYSYHGYEMIMRNLFNIDIEKLLNFGDRLELNICPFNNTYTAAVLIRSTIMDQSSNGKYDKAVMNQAKKWLEEK